jgi:transposase
LRGGDKKINQTSHILGLGIDISKSKANICLKEDSKVLENFIVTNDEEGITTLINKLGKYININNKKEQEENCLIIKTAIESTGNLWINMYEALERQKGVDISLANPLKTKAIAEAKIKYDKLDASILADLARADLISKCYVPDKEIRDIRSLVRHRIDLSRRRTQLKNKVHNLLDKYMLKYKGDIFSKIGLQWLLANSDTRLSIVDKQILNSYLKEISTINELISDVEKEMANLAINDRRVELLLGFTGIDYYGALLLISEIGDITRFSNPKKLVSWVGLTPSLYQSGNISRTGRITKQGNSRIRWYLVEASTMAARYDPKMKTFYERILKKKGNQKARVAVARKMLVSIYYVLTRHELYHGHREELQITKIKNMKRISTR